MMLVVPVVIATAPACLHRYETLSASVSAAMSPVVNVAGVADMRTPQDMTDVSIQW